MYAGKKIHLIEQILKTDNDSVLNEVESLLSRGEQPQPIRRSFTEFAGTLTAEEVDEMKNSIDEGCEQIHPDDWK